MLLNNKLINYEFGKIGQDQSKPIRQLEGFYRTPSQPTNNQRTVFKANSEQFNKTYFAVQLSNKPESKFAK